MRRRGTGVGAVSLVLVLVVLCLTVFAVLTLASARGEGRLTQKLADSVTAYYEADGRATEIMAALGRELAAGRVPDSVDGVDIHTGEREEGLSLSYACTIDENRLLSVTLTWDGAALRVERWQELAAREWTPDDTIPVWTGN